MADNYLERKFEEHNAAKGKRPVRHYALSSQVKSGYLQVRFPCRRVFVTGGASGIGKAIVEAFRNAGCRVAFCDMNVKAGQTTAETTGSQFYPADVSDAEALDACMIRLLNAWGDIDIIINNAGISAFKPLEEMSVDDFDRVIATNLRPVFVTARRFALHRRKLGGQGCYGRIINICSTRQRMSEPGTEAYSASKGGIYSLTHSLSMSLSELGITVNSISPGWIECGDYQSLRRVDHICHPSQRVGKPEDVARLCLFLAQEENDFINGENIVVDGGMTRKMIYPE